MRRLALLALAACQSAPREPENAPRAELVMAAQLVFDIQKLRQGDWARYVIREEGVGSPQAVKYAAVGADADGVWVENKVPGDPNPFVIKSKFSWDGRLVESWMGEPGGRPAKVFPGKDDPKETPKPQEQPKVTTKTEEEPVTASGRTFACTRIVTTLTYSNGRTSTLTNWCSPEVPFSVLHEGKSYGGLVKRTFGKFTMELANFGNDARPELEIPK